MLSGKTMALVILAGAILGIVVFFGLKYSDGVREFLELPKLPAKKD